MTEERNRQVVREMFDLLNLANNWKRLSKEFTEHIQTEHRTLIQNFFRMCATIIEEYAKEKYYDDRNAGSLKWAQDVAKIDYFMPHI